MMTQVSLTKKIPGGKLLRVDVSHHQQIETVKITGDFFLHPEEAIFALEDALCGVALPLDSAALTQKLEKVLEEQHAEVTGFSPADLVAMLVEVLK